jgi:hypothetical protein
MQRELKEVKKIKEEFQIQKMKNKKAFQTMKVSSPTEISILHHCTFIHPGADLMSLGS